MKLFALEIATPDRLVFQDQAAMLVAPGAPGYLGILAGHTPLLTQLAPGRLKISQGDKQRVFACGPGLLDIRADRVTVLVDTAEEMKNVK